MSVTQGSSPDNVLTKEKKTTNNSVGAEQL